MKKRLTTIIFALCFLAGLSLLLYPLTANEWNNYRQSRLMSSYENAVAQMEAADEIDYEEEWEQADAYNEALSPYILPDSFAVASASEEADEAYMSALNLTGDGMMGTVQIPKIGVKLPIFHTTSEQVLQTAAGHLEGSSLPVGGEGTHAVVSAHRGLPSASLFTDLDQLKEGDYFMLNILDDILAYEVDHIAVVEPEDTQELAAVEGEDLVTLLTCTPYGVNSHRLLVRGHRIPYEEVEDEAVAASVFTGASLHTNYLLWVLIGLGVTGAFILLLVLYDRRSKKKAQTAGTQPDDITSETLPEETEGTPEAMADISGPEPEGLQAGQPETEPKPAEPQPGEPEPEGIQPVEPESDEPEEAKPGRTEPGEPAPGADDTQKIPPEDEG